MGVIFYAIALILVYGIQEPLIPHRGDLALEFSTYNGLVVLGVPFIVLLFGTLDETLLSQLSALLAVKKASVAPQPVAPPPVPGEEEAELQEMAQAPGHPIVRIEAEHSQQAVVNVMGFLNDQDIPLAGLEILEPNLESVFLHLTGKKLRE